MEQAAHSVFISYAHADRDWVTIAVNLLTAGGAKVFMDVRNIAYGDKWEDVLLSKLREVERVMVFWSRHAADSEWVTREWQLALSNGKRLVPVPIDDTPLPEGLSQFQALMDLKPLLDHAMTQDLARKEAPKAARSNTVRLVLLAATAVVLAVVVPRVLFEQAVYELPVPTVEVPAIPVPPLQRPEPQEPTEPPATSVQPTPLPQPVEPAAPVEPPPAREQHHEYTLLLPLVWPLLGVIAFAATMLLIVSRLRRRLRRGKSRDILLERAETSKGALDAELADRVVNMVFKEADKPF